jgi:hypothetical protein
LKSKGNFLKAIIFDSGGEYKSNDFDSFYKKHDIKRQFTTSYTPK